MPSKKNLQMNWNGSFQSYILLITKFVFKNKYLSGKSPFTTFIARSIQGQQHKQTLWRDAGANSALLCSLIGFYIVFEVSFQYVLDWFLIMIYWGAWVAQSVECLTLGFSSGHDLTVSEFEPHVGLCADRSEPAWDSLSLPLSLPLPRSLSLSQNKEINLKKNHNW